MSFLLSECLLDSQRVAQLDNSQLGQLIRQARSSNLLASLALRLKDTDTLQRLTPKAQRHLESELVVHTKQKRDLAHSLKLVGRALQEVDQPLILLKGAAYIEAGILASRGRLLSDIDLIVRRANLEASEQALNRHGWRSGDMDPYNERYYRQWMHEIPPLAHPEQGSTLDLHFTILPPTAAANIDASLLFEELNEVRPGVYTLCRQDMVIHSATHLFHEGEFFNGLRDLWDLDRMLREFSESDQRFWDSLVARARALDLIAPLYYGLRYAQRVFRTPVPARVASDTTSLGRSLRRPLMDFLFDRALRPNQPECRLAFTGTALDMLYIRSHYLRMPLHLLLPHLLRKAWMARFGDKEEAVTGAAEH